MRIPQMNEKKKRENNKQIGISAYALASGNIALIYNPLNTGRNILAISLSLDHGVTWKYPFLFFLFKCSLFFPDTPDCWKTKHPANTPTPRYFKPPTEPSTSRTRISSSESLDFFFLLFFFGDAYYLLARDYQIHEN